MERMQRLYVQASRLLRSAYQSMVFPAAIVLLVILSVTFWAARTAQNSLDRNLAGGVQMQTQSLERAIDSRFLLHVLFLRGATSSVDAIGTLDKDFLEKYLAAYKNSRAGATFSWIAEAHESNDGAWEISYIDPGNKADHSLEAAYRQNIQQAYDTNSVALSAYNDRGIRRLIISRPYYLVPGGSQPAGVIMGVVDANTFFDRAISDSGVEGVEVRIRNGVTNKSPLLYTNTGMTPPSSTTGQKVYSQSGEKLLLELNYDRLSLVNRTQIDGPLLIASGGALAGLLIASIVYLLLTSRARELQLQQAQDIDLAKDDLISLASHQLRTPATGVKQYLGMVLQGFAGTVSDRQRLLLDKAYASNDRQLAVINEILHLAKIDSGRIVLAKRKTDIVHLVQDIVNEQDREIKAAGHILKTRYPKQELWMRADEHMLRMAIENLLSNAIKYTERGGTIRVSVRAPRDDIIISVTDSGVGIAPREFSKLFQQFTRITNKMSSQVSGTGVGLYLTKHLVELHDGVVAVESKEGVGSTFSIILPKSK